MKSSHIIVAVVLGFAGLSQAQSDAVVLATNHVPSSTSMADGEVRKVDKEQGKVTLKHGPIANLDMPGMTMVFRVADPRMLEAIKEGDKVKFAAEKVNGAYTVIAMEVAK
jgi:Cu(I)/Ag(I) efflux system periplasmic protein CusF